MDKNYFEILNKINVSDKTEDKNGLTYLSWAWAWGEIKKLFPDTNYKVYENENGCIYFNDGRTAWVKVSVTCNQIEHIEYLPIMDNRNNSIPLEKITSFDVNKSIQRALTKAIGRHGLGLYIYAGEDLPEDLKDGEQPKVETKIQPKPQPQVNTPSANKGVLASDSQRMFMNDLMNKKGRSAEQLKQLFGWDVNGDLMKNECSDVISYLKTLPDAPKGNINTKDVSATVTDMTDDDYDYPWGK